jgi:hypothetical protein
MKFILMAPMEKKVRSTSPWLESTPNQRRFPALDGEESADAVVIGGGIAGVMAAWRLAELGASVVLLEKGRIAAGETGFTTALVTRVPDASCAKLAKSYGKDFVKVVFAATREAQEYLRQTVKKEKIACNFVECSSYGCAYEPGDAELKEEWEVVGGIGERMQFVSGKEASSAGEPIAEAIRLEGEARFDVRKFIFGLLARPGAKRMKIFEESEAVEVSDAGSAGGDGGVVVKTISGGVVRAKKAIIATGMPMAGFEIPPRLRHYITFALVADYKNGAPFSDDIFWDTDEPYYYYRRLDKKRIILGGADVRAEETGFESNGHAKLKAFLDRRFPGEYEITSKWSGSIFSSEDGLPYVAPHPEHADNIFIATGFGGNGMVMGTLAGMILADLAMGKANAHAKLFSFSRKAGEVEEDERVKQPITKPTVTATSKIVPAALALTYLIALALPLYFFLGLRGGISFLNGADLATASLRLFPLAGLYAFTLVWLQVMIGTNMDVLRKHLPWIEKFHRKQGAAALLFAFAHPLMLLAGTGLASFLAIKFVRPELALFAWLGFLQLTLITCTAGSAMLMRHPWLRTRWRMIHYANYLVFASVWVHSWFLGTDVNGTALKYLWLFYLAAAVLALVFRIKRAKAMGKEKGADASAPTSSASTAGKFVRVASVKDVAERKPFCAEVNGVKIALFKVGGKFYALENSCSHAGGPLCGGTLEGKTIECPWHGSKFDISTGKVVASPAIRPQKTFAVRVAGENIEVMV